MMPAKALLKLRLEVSSSGFSNFSGVPGSGVGVVVMDL